MKKHIARRVISFLLAVCLFFTDYLPTYASGFKTISTGRTAENIRLAAVPQLNVTATLNENGSITVNWTPISGAVKYSSYMAISDETYVVYNEKNLTTTTITTEPNLAPNKKYTAIVVAYGSDGMKIVSDAADVRIPYDFYRNNTPDTPQNIQATSTSSSVTVSFSKVSNAESYEILFDNKTYSVTGTSHMITGLKPNTSYKYKVRSVNGSKYSDYTPEKSIKTTEEILTPPTGIKKSATHTSATISWNPVSGASGYEIYFAGTFRSISSTSAYFTNLSAGSEYKFRVRSKNYTKTSSYTDDYYVITPPYAPTSVAKSTANSVTISWNKKENATGYTLKFNGTTYDLPGDVDTKTITGLHPDTEYIYAIRCKSDDGVGVYSTDKTVKTLGNDTPKPLGVPTNVSAKAEGANITLSWDSVPDATSYEILFNRVTYTAYGTKFTISDLSCGSTYSYRVAAKKGNERSVYSPEKIVTVPPYHPVNIKCTATESTVTVKWNSVENATGYSILLNGTEYALSSYPLTKTFTGLSPDTRYEIKIACRNTYGVGIYSTTKSITTAKSSIVPPAVPSGITKSATDTEATIRWNAVAGATGYNIIFNGKTLSATNAGLSITGLTPNTEYRFKISAQNGTVMGSYTAEYTVRTAPAAPVIVARNEENGIEYVWAKMEDAKGYILSVNDVTYEVLNGESLVLPKKPDTKYRYKICTKGVDGASKYTEEQIIITPTEPPVTEKVTIKPRSVIIQWSAVPGATWYTFSIPGLYARNTQDTSITISDLSPGTTYKYYLYSYGEGGISESGGPYTVTTAPSTPYGLKAVATKTEITLTWSEYTDATEFDILFNGQEYSTTEKTKTFTNLEPDTEYTYCVRAKNEGGCSEYSEIQSTRTLPNAPEVPRNLSASSTYYSINLSWDAVPGATTYIIRYGERTITTGSANCLLYSLNADTEYTISVAARNAGGTSDYSEPITVKTKRRPPLPPEIELSSTTTSITATWLPVENADYYKVVCGTKTYEVEDTTITIYDLYPGTNYQISVCSANEGGSSRYTVGYIDTVNIPPITPINVKIKASSNGAQITWDRINNADSYVIRINDKTYSTDREAIVITDLESDEEYECSVKAVNDVGESEYSEPEIFRTKLAVPQVTNTYVTGKKAIIYFEPVKGAEVYTFTLDGGDKLFRTSDTYVKITDLEPNHEYYYTLHAENEYGRSEETSAYFTTNGRGPVAPDDITATSTRNSVTLQWSAVDEAESYDILFNGEVRNLAALSIDTIESTEPIIEGASAQSQKFMQKVGSFVSRLFAGSETENAQPMRLNSVDSEANVYNVGDTITVTFDNLLPGTEYSYCVRSNNSEASSDYTQVCYIKTLEACVEELRNPDFGGVYPDGTKTYTSGDPIDIVSGAFLWDYTCLEDFGKDNLKFVVQYKSNSANGIGELGRKWTYSFEYTLRMSGQNAYFTTPYDSFAAFIFDDEAGEYRNVSVSDGYSLQRGGITEYCVTASDGTEYCFDYNCRLVYIRFNGKTLYTLSYNPENNDREIISEHDAIFILRYTGGKLSGVSDLANNSVSFEYDEDSLVAIKNADGNRTIFTYDKDNNLSGIRDFSGELYLSNVYDEEGRVVKQQIAGRNETTVTYDDENRVNTFVDEEGNSTQYFYDENGHVTSVVRGEITFINEYDESGHLIKQTDGSGNITETVYDQKGRIWRIIYPDGTSEEATYNADNMPTQIIGRDGSFTTYEYDLRGNLTKIEDERGNVATYSYDKKDNLTSYRDKSGNTWKYSYDDNGHFKEITDPEGKIWLYSYNRIGRLLSCTTPGGETTEYVYSKGGKLLSIKDSDGEITYSYDKNGNRIAVTDKRGNTSNISYDSMGNVISESDSLGNQIQYVYDEAGRPVSRTDALGYTCHYGYDSFGNLSSYTDENGNTTVYEYDASNRLIKETDACGGSISYTYDVMGQLVSITDQLGHVTQYTYDNCGNVTSETDSQDNTIEYTYDKSGNVLTKTDAEGNIVSFTYDAENRVLSAEDTDGVITYSYDRNGQIKSIFDKDGSEETLGYDADGNIISYKNKEGKTVRYTYDRFGRVTSITDSNGAVTGYEYDLNGNCIKETDALGQEILYEYDALDRLIKATDVNGNITEYSYDAMGRVTKVTDARGNSILFEYDGNGNLIGETNRLGGKKTYRYDAVNRCIGGTDELGNEWFCEYDLAGNKTSYTDYEGNKWTYSYDSENRLKKVKNQNNESITYSYTPNGQVSSLTDEEGAVTKYTYDSHGRVTRITDAFGNYVSYSYDEVGNCVSYGDANGNVTVYRYSLNGNLLKETDPLGNDTVYEYNENGYVTKQTDAKGNAVSYGYDELDRIISITDASGNISSIEYTADGLIASITNAEGGITRYSYDALGNLTREIDALGRITVYEYDAENNRTKECRVEDEAESCVTYYEYNKKGQLVREISPLSEERTYGYDGNGNIVSVTDEEGRETKLSYDVNSNPLSVRYGDGSHVQYRYNKRGELIEVTDWNGSTVINRDVLGHISTVTDYNGQTVNYSYDAVGNVTKIVYPDEYAVEISYDKNNRMMHLTADGLFAAQYTYDALGNIVRVKTPDAVSVFEYNVDNLPVKATYSTEDTLIETDTYSYDLMGRIISAEKIYNIGSRTDNYGYVYDDAGQLTSITRSNDVVSYLYDNLGNRVSKSLNGDVIASYTYNAKSQLTSRIESGNTYNYVYDRIGNLKEEWRNEEQIRSYTYGGNNKLSLGINLETGEKSGYCYNGLGQLVSHTTSSLYESETGEILENIAETLYINDLLGATSNPLVEYVQGSENKTYNIYGNDYQILASVCAGDIGYYLSDLYNTPIILTDGSNNVLDTFETGIWGEFDVLKQPKQFTSYRYDCVIGKYYANARFYDPATGRMLSVDPVKSGINRYHYCDNDPVNKVDPTGEISALKILAGGALGFVAGAAGSCISQKINGDKIDFGKAFASGLSGGLKGATQAALMEYQVASKLGAGVANFVAGAVGDAIEQYSNTGKVNILKAGAAGLGNAIGNAIYGTKELKSVGNALARGFGAGAAESAIDYVADSVTSGKQQSVATSTSSVNAITYDVHYNPKNGCTGTDAFSVSIGSVETRGYTQTPSAVKNGFSLKEFAIQTVAGGFIGGVTSTAFYGIGKVADKSKSVLKPDNSDSHSPGSLAVGKGEYNNLNDSAYDQGFSSFRKLKELIGSAGEGNDWHHIVEQSQIKKSGFSPKQIHSTNNIIAVDHATHMKITGYYNTKSFRFTGGLSVRDWLAGQNYETQHSFGIDVLRKFGVIK